MTCSNARIVATRALEHENENPESIIRHVQSDLLLMIHKEQIRVCHSDYTMICAFGNRRSTIDSALFDSGEFVQSAGIESSNQIILFSMGNQLLYGCIPNGNMGIISTFPSRVQLLYGSVEEGQFLFSVPNGCKESYMSLNLSRNENQPRYVQMADNIFRCYIDSCILKLEILMNLSHTENTSLIDELTSKISEKPAPFPFVRRTIDSSMPKKYSLRLLRSITAQDRSMPYVHIWLFELGCMLLDVHFAYERLSSVEAILSKSQQFHRYQQLASCMGEHWLELAESALCVGEMSLAKKCHSRLTNRDLPISASLTFGIGDSSSLGNDEKTRFQNTLKNLLAGKIEKASKKLEEMGLTALVKHSNLTGDRDAMADVQFPIKLLHPTIHLKDFFSQQEPTNSALMDDTYDKIAFEPEELVVYGSEDKKVSVRDPFDSIFD
eukprot:CAMPEP_0201520336 /NCGR_PEP_ID=MMETSP0161_2-20130828/10651_1 /ASSEMBLY_ACC=CAM_ASM_000251 /TAXON_ID=180227 /ORGANISM="Neoparamoeba aestuarina, Strain SoJaBio B1-5/56/2" /LENGTH=437 /DNA_ID=CAMNT_0047918657 /DNA_START=102 /DNA_END=1412 /DNA_ORIENTATION=+